MKGEHSTHWSFKKFINKYFDKMYKRPLYKAVLVISGLPLFIVMVLKGFISGDKKDKEIIAEAKRVLDDKNLRDGFYEKSLLSEKRKAEYLESHLSDKEIENRARKYCKEKYSRVLEETVSALKEKKGQKDSGIEKKFSNLTENTALLALSVIICPLMYLFIFIYSRPYLKYISERVFMMLFVVLGVVVLVFTILYISPMDPASNILGKKASPEQVAEFRRVYGLDRPYIVQLFDTFKKCVTFEWGNSYVGNENVMDALTRKFPITVQLSLAALFVSVAIAIPSGIISAVKPYSSFDYLFMFIAMLGLSIPNFWLGLILILTFSIKLGWLPAMYDAGNWMTFIMPAIVIGTGLSATVARMTRSAMLEIKSQDYILTARAKGLSEKRVILKHILGNAMIPIVTVIGLQFGGLLGGSAVTEKVFNVNGIGKYIVDKQFIPDTPVILAGVVYVAIVISFVNLAVDILYAFLDPRIKSQIKSY